MPGLEFIEIVQAALAAQVTRRVDDGLDPQGQAVFEVLLDAGVLVEGDDGDLDAAANDPGRELADGVRADPPVEDDLDGVRAAEIEVVGDQGVKAGTGAAG